MRNHLSALLLVIFVGSATLLLVFLRGASQGTVAFEVAKRSSSSVLVAVATALKYGSIRFQSSERVDAAKIPGMFLYLSTFFLPALPVLGSAARMRGTYRNSDA